jgi:hypothetical protein
MLKNQAEIDLLKSAMEPGIRKPDRPHLQFSRIVNRFMKRVRFQNSTVVDLGPGHFDFADVVAQKGASVIGVELDPPVAELGRMRGHRVILADLREILLDELLGEKVDGLFCNGSINAYWFHRKPKEHIAYIEHLDAALKTGGWAWIAPWNGPPSESGQDQSELAKTLQIQRDTFARLGYRELLLNRIQIDRYHVSTVVPEKLLFTKGLRYLAWPW